MNNINKLLEYHELLMTYNDTSQFKKYDLPAGYHFEFYKDDYEILDWVNIHIKTGEFTDYEYAINVFHEFYDNFIDELDKRCIFIVNDKNEKVGTGTISLVKQEEFGYNAVVDWVAIDKNYQGKHLARPLISALIELAYKLGHNKILLHTQTHTWLAVKLYLDAGFEPFNIENSYKGWQIIKTLTKHPKLINIDEIEENNMYFNDAALIYKKLEEIYQSNFEYCIWHTKGRHSVEVLYNGMLYKYTYTIENNEAILNFTKDENKYVKVMFGKNSGAISSLEYKVNEINISNIWNPNEIDPKKMGGFNFSTEDKILRWLVRGDTIYDVELPKGSEVIDCLSLSAPHGVFRCNKIILKNPRPITDDMAMDFYIKSKLPEKSYFKAMAGCAVRGHIKTAHKIFDDKVNNNNIDIALSEFLDFCKPKEGWDKEIDKQFGANTKLIYDLLMRKKNNIK